MTHKYGHTTGEFTSRQDDTIFPFERHEENGDVKTYTGIITHRDLSGENVVNIGSYLEFRTWLDEFKPPQPWD